MLRRILQLIIQRRKTKKNHSKWNKCQDLTINKKKMEQIICKPLRLTTLFSFYTISNKMKYWLEQQEIDVEYNY